MALALPVVNLKPVCFEKSWNDSDCECVGGLDPAYTHPVTEQNVRDPCPMYASCGSRTRVLEFSEFLQVRFPVTNTPSFRKMEDRPPVFPRLLGEPEPSRVLHPVARASPGEYATQAPRQEQPRHEYSPGSFLSVPEVREPGEPWYILAIRTSLRAAMKGATLGVLHVVDTVPWGTPPKE